MEALQLYFAAVHLVSLSIFGPSVASLSLVAYYITHLTQGLTPNDSQV